MEEEFQIKWKELVKEITKEPDFKKKAKIKKQMWDLINKRPPIRMKII